MGRTFEEFSGKHQRKSDGVWFDYTATVEVIDGHSTRIPGPSASRGALVRWGMLRRAGY